MLSSSEEAIEEGVFAHNVMGAFQSGINHGSVQVMRDQMARRGPGNASRARSPYPPSTTLPTGKEEWTYYPQKKNNCSRTRRGSSWKPRFPRALVREMELDENGYPPPLWRQMADLGWLGLAMPEEYGGQGLPLTYLGW